MQDRNQVSMLGLYLQASGGLMQDIAAYHAAQGRQHELQSAASSLDFESTVAGMNARQAELDAQAILQSGRHRVFQLTAQRGQERQRQRVSAAARGVQVGVGSAAEVEATTELVKQVEARIINLNTVRAAGQQRLAATNFRNQASIARVSARNMRRSASTISPGLALFASSAANAGRFIGGLG